MFGKKRPSLAPPDDDALKRYDVALPNRAYAKTMHMAPPVLMLGGAVTWSIYMLSLLVRLLQEEVVLPPTSDLLSVFGVFWLNWGFPGTLALAVCFIGVALEDSPGAQKYDLYYRCVYQGRIVRKNTEHRGPHFSAYTITIEGLTYANEKRQSTWPVSADFWQSAKIGDVWVGPNQATPSDVI